MCCGVLLSNGKEQTIGAGPNMRTLANSCLWARVHTVGFYLYQVLEQVKAICARDYPGGPVVKNPPCNAGDLGSIRGWGTKIPHATEQLSLHVATRESTHHNERSRMT